MRNQRVIRGFLTVIVVEPATLKRRLLLQIDWRQNSFSLIYFFESFCMYYLPHNYVIPQAMPHVIPQTTSAFYPHRRFMCSCSLFFAQPLIFPFGGR